MDKFETNLKLDQLEKAIKDKKAEIAVSIAEEIEWKKEKDVQNLVLGANAYRLNHDYEAEKELLLMAYERTHMGKNLAFRLAVICSKLKQFDEADDFYQDFIEIAPRDTNRYILQYTIAKAKGMPVGYLVGILEEYVDIDMEERWMYELACLYDQAGDTEKCVELCDEMSLWFSHGKYVKLAMDLKKKYKPLTKSQEANYNVEDEDSSEENAAESGEASVSSESKDSSSDSVNNTGTANKTESDKSAETYVSYDEDNEKEAAAYETDEKEHSDEADEEEYSDDIDEEEYSDEEDSYEDEESESLIPEKLKSVSLGAIDIISGLTEAAKKKKSDALAQGNETATAIFEPVRKTPEEIEEIKKGNTIPFTTLKTEEFRAKAQEEAEANKTIDVEDIDNDEVLEDPIMEAVLASEKLAEESVADTVQIPGEINIEDIHVKSFEGDGSDTIDLQAVIARNIREIMNSEEQMKEIKIENEKPKEEITMTLDPLYKYDENGQIGFDIPEPRKAEKEITGQLSIEEVLRNLENRGILKADTVNKTVETMDMSALQVDNAAKEAAQRAEEERMNTTIVEELDAKDLADETEMEDVKAALESYVDDAINGFVFTEEIDSEAIEEVLSDTAPIPLAEIELEDSKPETMEIGTMNIEPINPVDVLENSEDDVKEYEIHSGTAKENEPEFEGSEDLEEESGFTEAEETDEKPVMKNVISVKERDKTDELSILDMELDPNKNKKLDDVMLHTKDLKAEVEAVFETIEAEKNMQQEAQDSSDGGFEDLPDEPEEEQTKVIPDILKALEEMKEEKSDSSDDYNEDASGEDYKDEISDNDSKSDDDSNASIDIDNTPIEIEIKDNVAVFDLDFDAPVKKLHASVAPLTKPSPANTASLKELFANLDKATKEDKEDSADEQTEESLKNDKGEEVSVNSELPEVKKKTNKNITQTLSLDLDKIVVTDAEMVPFESFKSVNGLEQKIKDTVTNLAASYCGLGHSRTGNIMILGDDKSGKTTMAIELIKLVNRKRGRHGRRIAKVDASVLNTRGIRSSMKKLVGSDLIVENAQHLRKSVLTEFVSVGQYFTDDMIMVFEGETSALKTMRAENEDIAKMFDNVLVIKEYDVKEWVAYAKKYAATRNYMIDEMGTLALYKAIDDFYSKHQGIDQADVENILNKAIKRASSKVTRKLTNLFSGKNDDTGMDILREADFK
ncbi:MAG: hypothetical protein K6G88_14125 [Lachnospiraceae bacterium]|nr:hypothetical protein [Lachnospiraceae bacterium]